MTELAAAVLTRRELEIARLAAQGLTNRSIAEWLTVSTRTVDAHIDHVFRKTGIRNRTALVHWLAQQDAAAAEEKRTAMASGPEHYVLAEQLLGELDEAAWHAPAKMAAAQVHATLALAAASALGATGAMPLAEYQAWADVCGEPDDAAVAAGTETDGE